MHTQVGSFGRGFDLQVTTIGQNLIKGSQHLVDLELIRLYRCATNWQTVVENLVKRSDSQLAETIDGILIGHSCFHNFFCFNIKIFKLVLLIVNLETRVQLY